MRINLVYLLVVLVVVNQFINYRSAGFCEFRVGYENSNILFLIHSNLVITNCLGPFTYVRYNHDIVIAMKINVINSSFGTGLNLNVIPVNS